MDEITASYQYKGVKKEMPLPALAPHTKGVLHIPGEPWEEGEPLLVEFHTPSGRLIDAYRLTLGREEIDYPEKWMEEGTLKVVETENRVLVQGAGFEIPFDKASGLITNAKVGNDVWIEQGPFLNMYVNLNHLSGAEVRKMADHYEVSPADWKKTSFAWRHGKEGVYVDLKGTYKQVRVNYALQITPSGEITVEYEVGGAPNGYLRETGLAFRLADAFHRLAWKRKGYWSCYPEDALAGNEGTVPLFNTYVPAYGQKPDEPWAMDTHNYYYWADQGANCRQPLTQAAKGMKEHIYYYSLQDNGDKHTLSVLSTDASVACRLYKLEDEQLMLYVNNRWDYPEIAWGNYCKQLEALPCYGRVLLRLGQAR